MLNKSIFSFLIAILLSNNPLRAMEDPSIGIMHPENLQVDESAKEVTIDPLKLIAARKVDALILNDVISGLSLDNLPEELREYCMITINEDCASLKRVNDITEKSLEDFKKLVCELYKKQGKAVCIISSILPIPSGKGFTICFFKLEEINTLLGILIRCSALENILLTEQELDCRNKIIIHALRTNKIELGQLLISNNLLPRLDDRIKTHNMTCSFLKHLVYLSRYSIDLFNIILNEEKNKNYNWKELFDQEAISKQGQEKLSDNIVQMAASESYNDAILKLVKEKELLEEYINIRDSKLFNTPLMNAARNSNVEAVKFLIENGAHMNTKFCDGKTALHYAQKEFKTYERFLNEKPSSISLKYCEYWEEKKQRASECVKLLEEAMAKSNRCCLS